MHGLEDRAVKDVTFDAEDCPPAPGGGIERGERGSSWPKRKLRSALIPAAIAQRPSGANIVERIARHRLAARPSHAIVGMWNVLLGKRRVQGGRSSRSL
jgi:hypothetical protein